MNISLLFYKARRVAASLAVIAGFALAPAATIVRAAESDLPPPRIEKMFFQDDTLYIMFMDNAEGEFDYRVDLWLRDNPDVQWSRDVAGLGGSARMLMRGIENTRTDQPICARMFTAEETDVVDRILHTSGSSVWYSDGSNSLCVDPARKPPDLVVADIRGPEVTKVTPARAVLLLLKNEGADAVGNVTVTIQTSGVVRLADDQAIIMAGWQSMGFNCTRRTPSGGANGVLRCTGGTLKQGASVDPGVILALPTQGFGSVYVSMGLSGAGGEDDTSDNGLAHNIQVTP